MKCNYYFLQFTLFFLLFASQITFGQNVGIGTEDPQDKLEVSDTGSTSIRITSTDASGVGLTLQNLGATYDWRMSNFGGNLNFSRGDADGIMSSRVRFGSDGRFGFGDTTPDTDFEIALGSASTEVRITASGLLGQPMLDLMAGIDGFATYHWRIAQRNRDFVLEYGRNEFAFDSIEILRANEDGSVGIGTNDPLTHLHVAGSGDQNIRVHSTGFGGADSGLELVRGGEFDGTDWKIMNDGGTFKILDGINNFETAGTENMRITNSGNVGINQTTPEARLHVTGTLGLSGTSGGNYFKSGSSSGSYVAIDNNEIGARNSSDEPSTLYLQYWGGNLNLAQNDDGRVGIGTSSPQAKVHITDGADVTASGGGELILGPTSGLNMGLDGNEIQARNGGSASTLVLQQGGGDIKLIPNENGQVGIGILSNFPSDDYLLAVDGKIISEEVRVELSGNWWPDYVFEESYALTPLAELEKQIAEKGHLPGIPSAKVVEAEGFELGDMQRRAIEKIEELT